MLKLTEAEKAVIELMVEIQSDYDNGGYGVGYSDIMFDDFVDQLGINENVVKGLLGSLCNKGYISYMDVNGEYNVYYITSIVRKEYNMEV